MRYAHNPHLQRRNHRKGCCAPDNHADGRPGLGLRQQRDRQHDRHQQQQKALQRAGDRPVSKFAAQIVA